MRGFDEHSGSLFSYVDLETRVPKEHPLRAIRAIANSALPMTVFTLDNYIAKIDANANLDPTVISGIAIPFGQALLQCNCAFNCIDHASELSQ